MAAGPSPPDLATWGHLLGFSLEDLALNRRGIVSPDQLRGWVPYIISDAVLPFICLGCAVLVAYMPKPWWRWLIVAGMVGLSTLSSMNFVRRIQDHQHPQTLAVEGKVEIDGGSRNTCYMRIGSKSFTLRADAPGPKPWELIDSKTTYRVYYLRYTERALSMEPVATDGKPD